MTKGQGEYPDVVRVAIGWKLAVRCDSFVTWQEAKKKKSNITTHLAVRRRLHGAGWEEGKVQGTHSLID